MIFYRRCLTLFVEKVEFERLVEAPVSERCFTVQFFSLLEVLSRRFESIFSVKTCVKSWPVRKDSVAFR